MQRSLTASVGGERKETSKSLQLSALFTTMMESNALLREEIGEMVGRECAMKQQRQDNVDGREEKPQERSMVNQLSQLHSQSLPARLLESSVLSHQPTEQCTKLHSSLIAASKSATSTGSLGSESESESEEGTDEAWEGEEWGNHSGSGSSESTGQQHSDQLHRSPLPPLSITSISSTEVSSTGHGENDPFASPGESTIETMWDDFSVEEYAPPLRQREKRMKVHSREPVQQAWSPRVTIPEPFAMTVREEGKPKTKSRMLILAEQEKLERQLQEEMECQKRFRALPVPATTYVPLDELRREQHEQMAQSGCDRAVHVHSIKPFNFMKREEEKRQRKLDELKQRKTSDKNQETVFKAKPIPHRILSPQISEELREKEDYRKILIRVRSREMLARAELPRNMQVRQAVRKHRRERLENQQSEAFVTKEHTFHPNIKPDIPDHKQLYFQFQQQMAVRKEVKAPTTPRPFLLRTSSAPSRKVHIRRDEMDCSVPSSHTLSSSSTGVSVAVPQSRPRAGQPMYNVQMTETAKLRKSISERKLTKEAEKEFEEQEGRRHKKEQLQELHSKVLQQVQSYDHSAWLQEKQREKLQELRFVRYTVALFLILELVLVLLWSRYKSK